MLVFKWLQLSTREDGYAFVMEDYDGPLALAGGGNTVENETVPTGPYEPQIPFILGLFSEAARLYNQGPPQAYSGQLTPDINPNIANTQGAVGGLAGGNIDQNNAVQQFLTQLAGSQNLGAELGQSLVPGIQQGIDAQLDAGSNPLTGSSAAQLPNVSNAYDTVFGQTPTEVTAGGTQGGQANANPALAIQLAGGGGKNPYLDRLVQGAIQGSVDSFSRNVLPGIRSEAQAAGQIGGTRQGIAEGNAANDLIRNITNTTGQIYGNAFNTQAGLQGQALANVLSAQQADQSAGLQAAGLTNNAQQAFINSLLAGTGQVNSALGQGLNLGYNAIGTGTAQAGNLFSGGNQLQLTQALQSLGLLPGFQASSLGQLGAVNQLGLQQYGLEQSAIDSLMEQYYFNQNSPFNLLSQYQQYITGPYGSTVGPAPYGGFLPSPSQLPVGPNAQPAQPPPAPITPPVQPSGPRGSNFPAPSSGLGAFINTPPPGQQYTQPVNPPGARI